MIFVWLIVALGFFVFITQVGEGLNNYLSNKAPKEENEDEPKNVS